MGDSYKSYIALDDLITGPLCIPYNEDLSTSIAATPPTTPIPLNYFNCDFECNCPCSWNFDPTGTTNWQIKQGASDVLFTGPSADHTLQSSAGHYAYIITKSPVVFNDVARLISQNISIPSNGMCFQFFYHMYGTSINRLNIYAKQNNNLGKAVWQKIGEQGNKWNLGHVYLEKLGNVQLVIEGVAGNGIRYLILYF